MKHHYGLALLRVRGVERVRLHADLVMLARLSLGVARSRTVPVAASLAYVGFCRAPHRLVDGIPTRLALRSRRPTFPQLSESASAAITVYDSQQTWGRLDRGIQLLGAAHAAGEEEAGGAKDVYAARFPDFRAKNLWAYRFYVFQPERVKLFDEVGLGGGRFVVAAVDESGRLSWETTEIYRSES